MKTGDLGIFILYQKNNQFLSFLKNYDVLYAISPETKMIIAGFYQVLIE